MCAETAVEKLEATAPRIGRIGIVEVLSELALPEHFVIAEFREELVGLEETQRVFDR